MAVNDFLPFATAPGANVEDQATWAADPDRPVGFRTGLAKSFQINKAIRQATFVASSISEWVNGILQIVPIPDDGNVQEWVANFDAALRSKIQGLIYSLVPPLIDQEIQAIVPGMIQYYINAIVPGMIMNYINAYVPGMINQAIAAQVPGMIMNYIDAYVPGMINGAIASQVPGMIDNALANFGSPFPEAPMDGRQYGRQMASWTVVQPPGGGPGGGPAQGIRFVTDTFIEDENMIGYAPPPPYPCPLYNQVTLSDGYIFWEPALVPGHGPYYNNSITFVLPDNPPIGWAVSIVNDWTGGGSTSTMDLLPSGGGIIGPPGEQWLHGTSGMFADFAFYQLGYQGDGNMNTAAPAASLMHVGGNNWR